MEPGKMQGKERPLEQSSIHKDEEIIEEANRDNNDNNVKL
jgi:hypothetical protein